MFIIFTSALGALIGLSVHGAANRRFFDEGVSNTELARFNGNCLFILLISTVVGVFILNFIDLAVAKYLGVPNDWVYLGVISVFFGFVLNIRLGQWQVRGKAKLFGFTQVMNALLAFSFSLLLIVLLHLGAEGRIYGIVLTSLIIGSVSYYTLRSDGLVLFKYNKYDFRAALSFGVPLIPHVLGSFLLLSVDRLVINKELGLEMTGIYMVAVSLGSVFNLIFSSINKAYSPWLFEQLKSINQAEKKSIVSMTYIYIVFLILIGFLVLFIGPPILKIIIGEKFHQAADLVPMIVAGQIFLGMYFMVTNYIFYVKKTKYLSYITISSGVINIGLLFVLIPYYGLSGAALAFIIANFWQFICTWIVSAKLYAMPWALWRY